LSRKAVALISGGLDSVSGARIVMEQGYEVTGLYFTSAFSKSYGKEKLTAAAVVSKTIGIDLRVMDLDRLYRPDPGSEARLRKERQFPASTARSTCCPGAGRHG